ncbi:flagellar protein FlaG [Paenibacillus tritici]|uniref:flagellar protein FlaG n=1 Tax=Paenibacillus tritici TaxID=1873425 RepID=UPI001BA55E5F|nr:flagellar protein FlaG [Paenibacillus tritici]QUL58471.1 flagellar protein FlaG [Paenibacillus tritici]
MNVQFSLSASSITKGQSKSEVLLGNGATAQFPLNTSNVEVLPANNIKDARDLNLRERQGVNVSVAEEQLIKTIERAVKSLQGPQTTLEISIHEKTHDIMVKVMNKDTGELIREVPPEKTLDLVAKMMEIAGILVDEKI